MRERLASSDHHLSHENIRRPDYANRPFDSVDEMNDALVTYHNETVRPQDEVWFLGDVAMGRIAESLPLVAKMHGTKHLIMGNHDRVFDAKPGTAKCQRWYSEYGRYFSTIREFDYLVHGGITFALCHFPYYGDSHGEDRFSDRRPPDEGLWLLHGHTHSKEFLHGERMIHVGVDSSAANYRPIHLDAIVATINHHS